MNFLRTVCGLPARCILASVRRRIGGTQKDLEWSRIARSSSRKLDPTAEDLGTVLLWPSVHSHDTPKIQISIIRLRRTFALTVALCPENIRTPDRNRRDARVVWTLFLRTARGTTSTARDAGH